MLRCINTVRAYPTGEETDPGYAVISIYDGLTRDDYFALLDLKGNERNEYLHLDKPDEHLIAPGASYCYSVKVLTFTRTCVVVERRYNYNI